MSTSKKPLFPPTSTSYQVNLENIPRHWNKGTDNFLNAPVGFPLSEREIARNCRRVNSFLMTNGGGVRDYIVVAPSWDSEYHIETIDTLASRFSTDTITINLSFYTGFNIMNIHDAAYCPEQKKVQDNRTSSRDILVVFAPFNLFLWGGSTTDEIMSSHAILFLGELFFKIAYDKSISQEQRNRFISAYTESHYYFNNDVITKGSWVAEKYPVSLQAIFVLTFCINMAVRYNTFRPETHRLKYETLGTYIMDWISARYAAAEGAYLEAEDYEIICQRLQDRYGEDGNIVAAVVCSVAHDAPISTGEIFVSSEKDIMPISEIIQLSMGYAKNEISSFVATPHSQYEENISVN